MINSDATEEDSTLISAMDPFDTSTDSKAPQIHISSTPNTLRIPSPASTVYITTPINDNEESGGMFPMEHQESFDLRNNSPVEKDLDTTTVFTSVTPASQYGMLSSLCSPDLTNKQEGILSPVTDQKSNTESICTATSSSIAVEPATLTAAPSLMSDVKSRVSPGNDFAACQQSIAESYVTLTPWTTKFASHGPGQMPALSDESLPIPLISLNHRVCIPCSSNHVYLQPNNLNSTSYSMYSKIGSVSSGSNVNGSGAHHANQPARVNNSSSSYVGLSSVHKPTVKIKSTINKEHRFKKTADALQKSGLWEVVIKTGNLMKRNRELQKDLEQFRADALLFLKSVIKHPQNRDYIKNLFNNALSANATYQNKMNRMNVVAAAAAAAAAASGKLRTSSSIYDSGISSDGHTCSSGSQSDQSVTNFPCTKLETASPGSVTQVPMDTD